MGCRHAVLGCVPTLHGGQAGSNLNFPVREPLCFTKSFEKAWNFAFAFTHAFRIFWLLATLSLQAVPRRPAILVPRRLQCELYSRHSSTAEIWMSCQNIIVQFSARQPLLCGYSPCMRLWSVDQQEDLCFVLGLRGWQIFLLDPCAVAKQRTLHPGPALL